MERAVRHAARLSRGFGEADVLLVNPPRSPDSESVRCEEDLRPHIEPTGGRALTRRKQDGKQKGAPGSTFASAQRAS